MEKTENTGTKSEESIDYKSLSIITDKNNRSGFINSSGVLIDEFRFSRIYEFKCNRALFIQPATENNIRTFAFLYPSGSVLMLNEQYSEVYQFSEDLALVHKSFGYNYNQNLYGYIDNYGKVVIPLNYHGAGSFKEGLARVQLKGKWGFIDKLGNLVIPCKYIDVGDFSNGLAYVKVGEWPYNMQCGFINKNGEEVIPLIYKDTLAFSEGLAAVCKKDIEGRVNYGYININGETIIPFVFYKANSFNEGIASVSSHDSYSNTYLINIKGQRISSNVKADTIFSFKNGYATIYNNLGDSNFIYGMINSKGQIIFDPIFSMINSVGEDCYKAKIHKEAGTNLYDKNGIKLSSKSYTEIYSFIEGFAIVYNYSNYQSDLFGFINKIGKEIISCKYEDVSVFRNGIAAVKLDAKWGFIDVNGQLISKIEFDDICLYNFNGYINSLSSHNKSNMLAPILFKPPRNLKYFHNNIGFVIKDNKLGIINMSGDVVSPCIYESISPSFNNLMIYKRNGKCGFLNSHGIEICEPKYREMKNFSEGLSACNKDGKWGFVNEFGTEVIPCKYFYVGSFNYNLALVQIDNLYGYINKFDKVVILPKFSQAEDFGLIDDEILAKVALWDGKSSDSKRFFINNKGKESGPIII